MAAKPKQKVDTSAALSRDAILAAKDSVLQRVDVPEWGGHVFVRSWSGDERDAWEAEQYAAAQARKKDREQRGKLAQDMAARGEVLPAGLVRPEQEEEAEALRGMRAKLVASCTCDAEGAPLFTVKDVLALGQKNARALTRVWEVATTVQGIGVKEEQELLQD